MVEFAKLADRPQEMLIKVEEAVGPPHMRDDHEELIKMSEAASLNARSFESKQNQLVDPLTLHPHRLPLTDPFLRKSLRPSEKLCVLRWNGISRFRI